MLPIPPRHRTNEGCRAKFRATRAGVSVRRAVRRARQISSLRSWATLRRAQPRVRDFRATINLHDFTGYSPLWRFLATSRSRSRRRRCARGTDFFTRRTRDDDDARAHHAAARDLSLSGSTRTAVSVADSLDAARSQCDPSFSLDHLARVVSRHDQKEADRWREMSARAPRRDAHRDGGARNRHRMRAALRASRNAARARS